MSYFSLFFKFDNSFNKSLLGIVGSFSLSLKNIFLIIVHALLL